MRSWPKNISKNSTITLNTTAALNNQTDRADRPISIVKKTKSRYNGTSIGTKYYSDASVLDGLFNLADEKALRAIFRDMVTNDPTIKSGIELRCSLFDIDFSVSGGITLDESAQIKQILVDAGISDKIKTLVWNYFVYGEALMYVYMDDNSNKLLISNILNLDECIKRKPMFGNKINVEYSHGILGKKTDILELLESSLQKIRNDYKDLHFDFQKTNSINNFYELKELCKKATLEDNDLYLIYKYSVEIELGKSSVTDYLTTEFFINNSIDITAEEFPFLINDNSIIIDSKNLIYLDRSFVLEGGSTNYTGTNGHYQGLNGNASVANGSMLRTLVGLWMLESRYFRNTVNVADRRMSPPTWIQCGSKDEPISDSEAKKVGEDWKDTNSDPSNGATFVTNHLVNSVQPIDVTAGFWSWETTFDSYNAKKLLALGINDSWFSGDASYNTYESVATAFGCQIARDREYLTKKIFTEVLLPLISERLKLYKYIIPKIKIRIIPDQLTINDTDDFNNLDDGLDNNLDEIKINITPDKDTKIKISDLTETKKDPNITIKNIKPSKDKTIKIKGLKPIQTTQLVRLKDPIIKIQQEDKNNKKTDIKITLKNLDTILSQEDKQNILNKIDKITIKDVKKDSENDDDNNDRMFYDENTNTDDINISIKKLKEYDNPSSEVNIKLKNINSSNRILLSEALPKELIIPNIEWEVSNAPDSLDRIKSKIEMLREGGWAISPEYLAHLMGIDVNELKKFGCKQNTPDENDSAMEGGPSEFGSPEEL